MRTLFPTDTARFTAWSRFHKDNPQVFELFLRFTREAVAAGRSRFGARIIGERIRWYTSVETTGRDFKVNDHCWPYYARLATALHPQELDVFEFRDSAFDATVDEILRVHLGTP